MGSLKLFEETQILRTLSDLKTSIDREAARYLPDLTYGSGDESDLLFSTVPLADMLDDMTEADAVGLRLKIPGLTEETEYHYLTTNWSRHQLLQLVGAKERWFESVGLDRQVEELNARRHVLQNCMFRTMTADPILPIRTIRGIVSSRYADYPNTTIMADLVNIVPGDDTYAVRNYSGLTEKSFYCALVIDEPMGIPGFSEGYPGVIIKNSEVGYTSLWVTPCFYLPEIGRLATLEKRTFLRRVHRGKFEEVEKSFKHAMEQAAILWKGLQPKIEKLGGITYPDEAAATERLRTMLGRLKATKLFRLRSVQAYERAKHTRHNALNIFEAVCASTDTMDQDTAYDTSAIAGALLLLLTENI